MFIFSAMADNLPELISLIKPSLTDETVDPYLKLVEDMQLHAVSCTEEKGYGTDDVAALTTPVSSKRLGPYTSPKVVTLSVSKEINNEPTLKQDPELEPPHVRRPSATRFDGEMLSVPVESLSRTSDYTSVDLNFLGLVADDDARETSGENPININSVAQKFNRVLSPEALYRLENCLSSCFLYCIVISLYVILSTLYCLL
ncbi:hypothetical protein U1Q18_008899 [Sarracenia purpurea var. burkii]